MNAGFSDTAATSKSDPIEVVAFYLCDWRPAFGRQPEMDLRAE